MNVRLVTTWNAPCGIAEHSALLRQAVEVADPTIRITPDPGALDPANFFAGYAWANTNVPAILHLNYHAALHSQWTPEQVQRAKDLGLKIVITYHDTIGEHSPAELRERGDHRLDRLEQLSWIADALVVHEPSEGFPLAHYWRMGVPGPEPSRTLLRTTWTGQPVLGSIGLPFPWKNFDTLAQVTREIGWGLLLIAPGASPEQVEKWQTINPTSLIRTDFVPRQEAIALLSGCDATAFPYTGANTAQSAAILQGIAARKPVVATAHCRQFRALFADLLGRTAITWIESLDDLAFTLSHFIRIERVSPAIMALAEQESWTRLGQQYAQLYRSLL